MSTTHTLLHFIYSIYNFSLSLWFNKPSDHRFMRKSQSIEVRFIGFFALLCLIGVSSFILHTISWAFPQYLLFNFNQLVFSVWILYFTHSAIISMEFISCLHDKNDLTAFTDLTHLSCWMFNVIHNDSSHPILFTFHKNKYLTFLKIFLTMNAKKNMKNSIPFLFFHSFFFHIINYRRYRYTTTIYHTYTHTYSFELFLVEMLFAL